MPARDRDAAGFKSDRQLLEEIAGRARRLETKVTMTANHLGIDAGETKPLLDPIKGVLWVKTAKTSLEDIVTALGDFDGIVRVYCGDDYLAQVGL